MQLKTLTRLLPALAVMTVTVTHLLTEGVHGVAEYAAALVAAVTEGEELCTGLCGRTYLCMTGLAASILLTHLKRVLGQCCVKGGGVLGQLLSMHDA